MKHTKEEQMFELIEKWEKGDLSIKKFCLRENITYFTFQYWRKKLLESARLSGFVSIEAPAPACPLGKLELHYPNGVKITLPENSSLDSVQQLLLLTC